jgi:hypothetical protein
VFQLKNNQPNNITVKGQEIPYYRIDNDVNGNPRYVTHFLSLDVQPEDYGKIPGLSKYRAKWFGGGYVFQSYNLENTLEHALDTVEQFYKKD